MKTRGLGKLLIGLLLGSILAGCATSAASRKDMGGLPNAEHPDALIHPLRLFSLGVHVAGNVTQFAFVDPLYFVLSPMPDLVGLSLEERRYIELRQQALLHPFSGGGAGSQ